MILRLYDEFLAHHCSAIHPEDVQRLTTSLCGYLIRVVRASSLMRTAKSIGVDREFREFRRRIDNNPYSSSRLWRACWLSLLGKPKRAARVYEISWDDVEWMLSNLSIRQITKAKTLANGDWIRHPDYKGIEREVMSMLPYCERYVKKLKFIAKYDPSLTLTDFKHDMMAAGLSAAYRSDNRTDDLTWLRNIAWCSATNHAISIIKHHTTKGRQRIERQEKVVAVNTEVTIYQRTTCWRCKGPSETALCEECTKTIKKSKTERAKWQGRNESGRTFTNKRSTVVVKNAGPHKCDNFQSTVTFLDAPLRGGGGGGGDETTLLDMTSDKIGNPSLNNTTETSDLVHDLQHQPLNIQQVCAAILGAKDPEFDAWLHARHGQRAESIKDRRLAKEACEFYGVTRKKLERVMAPILGVGLHA